MAEAVEQRSPMQVVCHNIASEDFKARIEQALPPGVSVERFVRTTLTATQQNPEVIVDPPSLYQSVIRCAQDGLLPDGREAALVVFSVKGAKKVQYLPMIGGLRKRAAEYGIAISTNVVYDKDEFEWHLGLEPGITHKPPRLGDSRGEPIGAYAVATDAHGRKYLEVMSRQEIEEVRKVSRAATSEYGPWVKWWSEMARKTVARRLWKQLPLADVDERTARVLEAADDEFELDRGQRMTVEQANVHAAIETHVIPSGDGPDDVIDVEAVEVNGNGHEVQPVVGVDGSQEEDGFSAQQPSSDPGPQRELSFVEKAEIAKRNRAAKERAS